MGLLHQLFLGNVDINTRAPETRHYNETIKALIETEEELAKALEEGEGKEALRRFVDAHSDLNDITTLEKFVAGFSLGALLVAEAYGNLDALCIK